MVDIGTFAERFMRSQSQDIKRREPGILFLELPTDSLFKLAIMT